MDVSKRNTHFSHKAKSHLHYLLLYFFGEKIKRKTFFVDVWLEGGGKIGGVQVFSFQTHQNIFFPK